MGSSDERLTRSLEPGAVCAEVDGGGASFAERWAQSEGAERLRETAGGGRARGVAGGRSHTRQPGSRRLGQTRGQVEEREQPLLGWRVSRYCPLLHAHSANGFTPILFEARSKLGGVFRDAYDKLQLTTSTAMTLHSDFPAKDSPPKSGRAPSI